MISTIHLNVNELNDKFIRSLQEKFKGKFLEITVREADETEYLTNSQANKDHIDEAIARIEKGEGLVAVDFGKGMVK